MDRIARTKPSLVNLLIFILRTRLRLIVSGTENTALNIGRIFLIIGLIFYALAAAAMLLVSDDTGRSMYYILIMFSIPAIILSSGLFPVLKHPSSVVPRYAPIPGKQAGILNLVYNLFRPGTIYGLIFLSVTSSLTYSLGPWLLFDGILLIIATSALDFAVKQTVLSAQTRGIRGLMHLIAAGIVNAAGLGAYFVMYFFTMLTDPYVYTLYLLLFTISCVIYYTYTVELTETASTTSIFSNDSVGSKSINTVSAASRLTYSRNRSTKPMYLLIPAFNLIIGLYVYFLAEETMSFVFSLMLAFPLLPFTYVHNNFWGFFRETWLAVRLSPAGRKIKWKVFLGAVWIPLLLDAASSFAALVYSGQFAMFHAWIYLLLIPPIMFMSYWSSLRFPRKVNAPIGINQMTTFRNNTSGISSFMFILFCYLISFLMVLNQFVIAFFVVLVASLITIREIQQCEQNRHYKLQAKLFK